MSIQTHLIFDIETLGVKEDAVIATMAAIFFTLDEISSLEKLKKNSIFLKFSIDEQLSIYKRTTSESTLSFWNKQPISVLRSILFPSKQDLSLQNGFEKMKDFISSSSYDWKTSFIWSKRIDFDFPKIESAFEQVNIQLPFNRWKKRDINTAIDVLNGSLDAQYNLQNNHYKNWNDVEKHNCLDDCILNIWTLQEIIQSLS